MKSSSAIRSTLATLVLTASSHAADVSTVAGTYQGGGRACYGQLRIHSHTLSWRTPFSTCKETRFTHTDLGKDQTIQRDLFQLNERQPGCSYRSLVLTQTLLDGGTLEWEISGYAGEAARKANPPVDALHCPLIRTK